ncbi:MAG: hypothetical protein QXV17_10270 [Candidatus Micrarchaeaceae archaeon]
MYVLDFFNLLLLDGKRVDIRNVSFANFLRTVSKEDFIFIIRKKDVRETLMELTKLPPIYFRSIFVSSLSQGKSYIIRPKSKERFNHYITSNNYLDYLIVFEINVL